MFLRLDGSVSVTRKEVILVCDMDNSTGAKATRDFLSAAESQGELFNLAEDIPRSFVLCSEGGKNRVLLSGLNTATLAKR